METPIYQLSAFEKGIEINALGAELITFRKNTGENLLWEKTTSHWNRVAPLLFPIVGKLKGNSYSFQGKNYSLSQHGFLRDHLFALVEQTENSLTLEFSSTEDSKKNFPFDFTFRISYTLDEVGLTVSATVLNTGQKDVYFSYGGHPAFHLEDSIQHYSLRFQNGFTAQRHLIEEGLYSGATEKMEISGILNLSDDLFHLDAIVFKQPPFHQIELLHRTKGTILKMKCETWSAIGIWTKPGAPFLCLEPWWGWADSHDSTGDLTLKPGIRRLEKAGQESLVYHLTIG